MYYYYNINGYTYKYTCKKKWKIFPTFQLFRYIMPSQRIINKETEKFIPGEISHIEYENHTYIIPKYVKGNYINNTFKEEDFKDNLKLIGNYFKYMFINDITLDPTIAKSIFKKLS